MADGWSVIAIGKTMTSNINNNDDDNRISLFIHTFGYSVHSISISLIDNFYSTTDDRLISEIKESDKYKNKYEEGEIGKQTFCLSSCNNSFENCATHELL